jgi:hypothetical protein
MSFDIDSIATALDIGPRSPEGDKEVKEGVDIQDLSAQNDSFFKFRQLDCVVFEPENLMFSVNQPLEKPNRQAPLFPARNRDVVVVYFIPQPKVQVLCTQVFLLIEGFLPLDINRV